MAESEIVKAAPPGPPVAPNGPLGGPVAMTGDANAGAFGEIGVSGLKVASGYILEEFQNELRGANAVRVYRQMSEADSTVNAVLTAIGLVLRAVDWRVEPADDSGEAEKEAEFVESLLDDMSHPFTDVVGEAMSMLVYGWSGLEIVLKRRNGPDQKDPAQRSKFTDGRIGLRKLPLRSQDSLLRWEMQDDGGISGLWQLPPMGGGQLFIPIERLLLFRTTSRKNNPEGVSILRAAYKPWWLRKTVEEMEAIGIERELAGLPVVSIPSDFLAANATADKKAVLDAWKKVARDVKFNQQGGIVKPSDLWRDKDGNPVAEPMFKVELLSTGGRRAIDTGPVVERHEKNIARSALADFMMLGDQKGSYALSKNKSELFLRACEAYLNQIAEVLNRFLIPRIWNYNNLNRELMPELKPGRVAPVDLAEFGAYLQALAASGAPIWPNQDLLEYSMEIADAPAPPEDAGVDLQTGDNQDTTSNAGKPVGDGATESDAATSFMSGTNTTKAATKTLYVSRPVVNGEDIRRWAKDQGLASTLPPDDMHVTVAFSRQPVDWSKLTPDPSHVSMIGDQRSIKAFGENKDALVLGAKSAALAARHQQIRDAGASWDWPEYQPHVTLTYAAGDKGPHNIKPYDGPIILGPEKFKEVDTGWKDKVAEKPL